MRMSDWSSDVCSSDLAFIGRTAPSLMLLPDGATIGSSSLRRQALIRRARPDITVITFRGLVETRLRKLEEGPVDATLLAYARSEERRVGKASVSTCSSRWSPEHYKKKKKTQPR